MAITSIGPEDLENMEGRYRATFINSLGGFKSLVLIGTQDGRGQTNLAIFNSFFHIGANPPLCGLIFRPDSTARHTLENILATGEYTVNHVNETIFRQSHQTAARYERSVSEFEQTGLAAEYHDRLKAPYVQQSHLKFGMKMEQRIDLEINGTILLIGRIMEILVPGDCIGEDGFIDLEQAGTLTVSGLDSYHATRKIARLTYPKTDSFPQIYS